MILTELYSQPNEQKSDKGVVPVTNSIRGPVINQGPVIDQLVVTGYLFPNKNFSRHNFSSKQKLH